MFSRNFEGGTFDQKIDDVQVLFSKLALSLLCFQTALLNILFSFIIEE